MKKNHTTSTLIFSTLVAVLAICLLVFFLKVIENKNKHASVVLATLQEKMKEKEKAIVFAGKVAEIKLLQDSINSYFVDPNKIDTFVNYLEEIGVDLGSEVSVKNIVISPKAKNIIIFNLSINGTFKEVMRTITFLENIPYRINITQVYLNKDTGQQGTQGVTENGKTSNTPTWQADVSFNILSLN